MKITFAIKFPSTLNEYEITGTIKQTPNYILYFAKIKEQPNVTYFLREVRSNDKLKYLQETEHLKLIKHANIVRLYHCFYESQYYYMVYELVEGQSLQHQLEQKLLLGENFDEEDIFVVALEILSALQSAHSKGILHGDVSLDNIFLHKKQYKLLSWSSSIKDVTQLGHNKSSTPFSPSESLKTNLYSSPEIVSMKAFNLLSDIWSLGICLFTLCSMKNPFAFISKEESKILIQTKEISRVSTAKVYSDSLLNLIYAMSNRNYTLRPDTKESLIITKSSLRSLGILKEYLKAMTIKASSSSSLNSLKSKGSSPDEESKCSSKGLKYVRKHEDFVDIENMKCEGDMSYEKSMKEIKYLTPIGIEMNANDAKKQPDLAKLDINRTNFEEILQQISIKNSNEKHKTLTVSSFLEDDN